MSETQKYLGLTTPFCSGNGVDIGTGGYQPVVPNAIALELPDAEFSRYTGGRAPACPIQWRGFAHELPFKDKTLDWVYSSHLIEDFLDWLPLLAEWTRVLKIGGHLIVLLPDKGRWNEAIRKGQPCNCEHRHEGRVGELTEVFSKYFGHFEVVADRLTNNPPDPKTGIEDYTIIFVAKRVR